MRVYFRIQNTMTKEELISRPYSVMELLETTRAEIITETVAAGQHGEISRVDTGGRDGPRADYVIENFFTES